MSRSKADNPITILAVFAAGFLAGLAITAMHSGKVCDRDPATLTDAQYAECYAIEHDRWQP